MANKGIEEMKREAVEYLSKDNLSAFNIRAIKVRADFLGGSLVTLEYFENKAKPQAYECSIWFLSDQKYIAYTDEDLVIMILQLEGKTKAERFLSPTLIPGYIAVAMTIAIVVHIFVLGGDKVPEVLTASISVILGYYFAKATTT